MPRRKPKPPTIAQLARELAARVDPAVTVDDARGCHDIARELSQQLGKRVGPWQVKEALASAGKVGRPTHRAEPAVLAVTVERELGERARAAAEAAGVTIGQWVEDAIADQLKRCGEYDAVRAIVDEPPAPNQKLRQAFKRHPA